MQEPCSVIQGSVGSCVLYAIFTADLPFALHPHRILTATQERECPEPQVTTFVDDAFIVAATHGIDSLQVKSQESVESIGAYMLSNRLQLNIPKTNLLTVSPNPLHSVTIQTADQVVTSLPTLKALGLTFSENLSWDTYAKEVIRQLNFKITVLKAIKPLTDFPTIRRIATAIIQGKLGYSLPTWGNVSQHLQQRLQSSLLTAARTCLGPRHYRSSTERLLTLMKWTSFPQLLESSTSKLLHQLVSTGQPASLAAFLSPPVSGNTRSAHLAHLRVPQRRRMLSRRTISFKGVQAYNQTSLSHRKAGTARRFKKGMKEFLTVSRTRRVPAYHLHLVNPPPIIPQALDDLRMDLLPDGSLQRTQITLRKYLSK